MTVLQQHWRDMASGLFLHYFSPCSTAQYTPRLAQATGSQVPVPLRLNWPCPQGKPAKDNWASVGQPHQLCDTWRIRESSERHSKPPSSWRCLEPEQLAMRLLLKVWFCQQELAQNWKVVILGGWRGGVMIWSSVALEHFHSHLKTINFFIKKKRVFFALLIHSILNTLHCHC